MGESIDIGIIGGSGLYNMEALTGVSEISVQTPFGNPSDNYIVGSLNGIRIAFLSRHGRGHRLTPSELNYRANIFGFKKLGVKTIVAVTAVGSLRQDLHPQDVVLPDQFFDRTRGRKATFFGDGLVAHIAFAQPVCPELSSLLFDCAKKAGTQAHQGGSLICMEGPAFSTKAESMVYRGWGMDIIGMTSLTEAKLAREAEICYAPLAMVTDYDCWYASEDEVSADMVVENMQQNTAVAKKIIELAVPQIRKARSCLCTEALAKAIMTEPSSIPAEARDRLGPLVAKYL